MRCSGGIHRINQEEQEERGPVVRSTWFVKHVQIQMYLSRHPERKFYLMFPMKGIKHCLYTKAVSCIFPKSFHSCS